MEGDQAADDPAVIVFRAGVEFRPDLAVVFVQDPQAPLYALAVEHAGIGDQHELHFVELRARRTSAKTAATSSKLRYVVGSPSPDTRDIVDPPKLGGDLAELVVFIKPARCDQPDGQLQLGGEAVEIKELFFALLGAVTWQ